MVAVDEDESLAFFAEQNESSIPQEEFVLKLMALSSHEGARNAAVLIILFIYFELLHTSCYVVSCSRNKHVRLVPQQIFLYKVDFY
ncbi:MAG: hypothetical protein ACREBR_01925 [bacterium]